MNRLFLAAALAAAAASAPFAIRRPDVPAPARPAEIVSAPARPGPAFGELDLRSAWGACVALHLVGLPHPPEAGPRFVEAFFNGRLPEAATFVAAEIAGLDARGAVRIADRARSFDRALARLPSAPEALLRVFVERAEDPLAHVEAVGPTRTPSRGSSPIPRWARGPTTCWRPPASFRRAPASACRIASRATRGLAEPWATWGRSRFRPCSSRSTPPIRPAGPRRPGSSPGSTAVATPT